MPRRIPIFALLAAFTGGVSTAQANVTINFTATVGAGYDPSHGTTITSMDGFKTGDTIFGSVTYDPTASAALTASTYAEYPVVGAGVVDGGTTTGYGPNGGSLLVQNNGSTYYAITFTAYTPDNSEEVSITLAAVNPSDFSSDGVTIPSVIPLSSFYAGGSLGDGNTNSTLGLNFAPADSGSPVPEPASILAFATGLLGVALIRRRRA